MNDPLNLFGDDEWQQRSADFRATDPERLKGRMETLQHELYTEQNPELRNVLSREISNTEKTYNVKQGQVPTISLEEGATGGPEGSLHASDDDPLGLFSDDPLGLFGDEDKEGGFFSSLGDNFKVGLSQVGNMVDKGVTLATSNFVPKDLEQTMFSDLEEREKSRNQWANPKNKEQGLGGKLTSALTTLPMQVVAAPLSAIDTAIQFVRNGESLDKAYKAAGIDAAFTAAGFALPAGVGKTLLQKVVTGGLSNAALDPAERALLTRIAENKATQEEFAPNTDAAIVSGLIGTGMGAATHRPVRPNADTASKVRAEPDTSRIDPQMRIEDLPPLDMSEVPPRLPELPDVDIPLPELNRSVDGDIPHFGMEEVGTKLPERDIPFPKLEDIPPEFRDLLGLSEDPQYDGGVRYNDPLTGKPVQGMDESVPTIDFPLKSEALHQDQVIQKLREQAAEALPSDLPKIQDEFAKYLGEGYGIKRPQDAYTGIFEAGKELKLPVQRTHNAGMGRFKKQGGALNPEVFAEGAQKMAKFIKNSIKRKQVAEIEGKGIPGFLASAAVNTPKPSAPQVVNPVLKSLKNSAAGKGLADFSYLDKTPDEIIEISKDAEDIKRKPIQENIENGGLYRGLDTRNPIVKYTTERFNRASQEASRLIRDNLTDHKTGLKTYMRKLDPTAKGEIWSVMMQNEGQKAFTPEELAGRGFSENQIAMYNKFREVEDTVYNQINEIRTKLGMAEMDKRIAHIAGRFTGDFRFLAKRPKLKEDGSPALDENGQIVMEPIGHIGANTRSEANRVMNFMKERNPDWDFGKLEYKKIGKGNSAADRFAGLMEVVNQVSKNDSHFKEFVEAYKDLLKSDSVKFQNATRHAKGKKAQAGGIEGSEGNKPWLDVVKNAEEGMKAQLTYMEQQFQWAAMQKASQDVHQVVSDPKIAMSQPNAVEWSNMHESHVMGRNGGWVADAANSVLNTVGKASGLGHTNLIKGSDKLKHLMMQKYMGFMNIPFTITQLVQPLQSVPPMVALMKARGTEFSALKAGMEGTNTMMKHLFDNTGLMPGKTQFNSFEKEALKYAYDNSVFDIQVADHTRDINESKAKETFDQVADANIRWPEIATRGTTFMFFAHALKETGMPTKEVLSTAENLTRFTMTDYTPAARPGMYDKMGWMGDLASTLARYKHGEVSRLNFYGREAREGLKRGDVFSSVPLMTHLGASLALSGLVGVIGYNTADAAYRLFSEKVLKKPDSLTDMVLRSDLPETISHGIFSTAGVDMSSRFSNAKVIPENIGEFLVPYGAGVADVGESALEFAKHPNKWNAKRLAKSAVPSSMTGLAENMLFTEKNREGTNSFMNSRTGELNYNRTDDEMNKRAFGFRSMKESKESSSVFTQKQKDKMELNIRKGILEKAKTDYLSGMSPNKVGQKYFRQYLEAGSDKFDRDFQQIVSKTQLTNKERYVHQNAGGSYAGARNLMELFEKD